MAALKVLPKELGLRWQPFLEVIVAQLQDPQKTMLELRALARGSLDDVRSRLVDEANKKGLYEQLLRPLMAKGLEKVSRSLSLEPDIENDLLPALDTLYSSRSSLGKGVESQVPLLSTKGSYRLRMQAECSLPPAGDENLRSRYPGSQLDRVGSSRDCIPPPRRGAPVGCRAQEGLSAGTCRPTASLELGQRSAALAVPLGRGGWGFLMWNF